MKRTHGERTKNTIVEDPVSDSDEQNVDLSFDSALDVFTKEQVEAEGRMYVKTPKKTQYRMHAHINPFNPLSFDFPATPDHVDWSIHYPMHYGIPNNNDNKVVVNTKKHPIPGAYKQRVGESLNGQNGPTPVILDIGCGYGGLMFQLQKDFPEKLIMGMEIRDKVTNFVGEKINSYRHNSNYTHCMNIAVIRQNAMKALTNYFRPQSVEKIFFCFADPHFKRSNHRRRIVNTALLSEYAYILKTGGKIYTVTDVEDLHNWQVQKLSEHPMFEMVSEQENQADPCVKHMRTGTDESHKVIKKQGAIWHAVFRKRSAELDKEVIENLIAKQFFS